MARSILLILFMVVAATISLPLLLILWLISLVSKKAARVTTYCVARGVFRIMLFIAGTKVTLEGAENIPSKDTPVLFVSNHRSYFDIIAAYPYVPGRYGFVGKKEFHKIPVVAQWMQMVGVIFLDRENPREGIRSINAAADDIKEGYSMWICPEGTRAHGEKMIPFHEGSFKIAEKAGCPIVPVAFTHTDDILENHSPKVRSAHITIAVGQPLETAGLSRPELKALHQKVYDVIQQMYEQYV